LTLRRRVKKQRTQIGSIGGGAGASSASVRPGQIAQSGGDPHNAEQIRQHILNNPSTLRQLQEVKMSLRVSLSFSIVLE
jgi:hypothetical protein